MKRKAFTLFLALAYLLPFCRPALAKAKPSACAMVCAAKAKASAACCCAKPPLGYGWKPCPPKDGHQGGEEVQEHEAPRLPLNEPQPAVEQSSPPAGLSNFFPELPSPIPD